MFYFVKDVFFRVFICTVQVQIGFQPMLTKERIDKEKVILVSIVTVKL